jgi:hypothetical protein
MLPLSSLNERIWDEGVAEQFDEETVETQERKSIGRLEKISHGCASQLVHFVGYS